LFFLHLPDYAADMDWDHKNVLVCSETYPMRVELERLHSQS
jgi:hypothetical protein